MITHMHQEGMKVYFSHDEAFLGGRDRLTSRSENGLRRGEERGGWLWLLLWSPGGLRVPTEEVAHMD